QSEEVIQCTARDPNLDPTSVKLEYQALDRSWKPLEPLPGSPETFRCPDRLGWTGVLRAQATDLAKNCASKETNVLGTPAETGVTPAARTEAAGRGSLVGTALPPPPPAGVPHKEQAAAPVEPQAGRQETRSEKVPVSGPDLGLPGGGGERQASYTQPPRE